MGLVRVVRHSPKSRTLYLKSLVISEIFRERNPEIFVEILREISVEIPKMGGFILLRMRIKLENCACAELPIPWRMRIREVVRG